MKEIFRFLYSTNLMTPFAYSQSHILSTGGQSKEIYKTIYAGVLTVFPAWDECH